MIYIYKEFFGLKSESRLPRLLDQVKYYVARKIKLLIHWIEVLYDFLQIPCGMPYLKIHEHLVVFYSGFF